VLAVSTCGTHGRLTDVLHQSSPCATFEGQEGFLGRRRRSFWAEAFPSPVQLLSIMLFSEGPEGDTLRGDSQEI